MGADKVVFFPDPVKEEPGREGFHNEHAEESRERIIRGATYRDCSTVCLLPTPSEGKLHWKVADAFKSLMLPMNQKFVPMRLTDMEVGDAYNNGIRAVLAHPELSKWRFILTMEHDNTPPPDGLIKLFETMNNGPWAAVGGLYWTKGEGGQPMCYGDPRDPEVNFRPIPPAIESIQECRGVAMGFTLFDSELFRDKRLEVDTPNGKGWFRTLQKFDPTTNSYSSGTQDLDFCKRAGELGYRFAVDSRVRVGHVQFEKTPTHPAGFVW